MIVTKLQRPNGTPLCRMRLSTGSSVGCSCCGVRRRATPNTGEIPMRAGVALGLLAAVNTAWIYLIKQAAVN